METVVLDASALLAAINSEPGHDKLTPQLLSSAVCSTVNLAEVQAKLVMAGLDPEDALEVALAPVREVADFTLAQSRITGTIISETRLSLGDRACLALGISLSAPVYTADKVWKKLKLPIPIHVIR